MSSSPSTSTKATTSDFVEKWGVRLAKFSAFFGIVFGIFLIIAGVYELIIHRRYQSTTATVEDTKGAMDRVQTIKIYYTFDGQIYHQTLQETAWRNIGDKFTIYVNPDKPEEYIVDAPKENWSMIIGGILCILFSLFSVWLAKKTGGITGFLGMDLGIFS